MPLSALPYLATSSSLGLDSPLYSEERNADDRRASCSSETYTTEQKGFAAIITALLLAIMAVSQSIGAWIAGLQTTGLLLILLGIAGRVWCTAHIGGRKFTSLVTSGPFSLCRNPLYLSSLLAVFGAGLQSGSILFGVLAALCFMVVIGGSVLREEAALSQRFGDAYADYCRTVPRYWPGLSSWRSDLGEPVPTRLVLRTALEGSAFLLMIPAQLIIRELQDQGVIPVLIKLTM